MRLFSSWIGYFIKQKALLEELGRLQEDMEATRQMNSTLHHLVDRRLTLGDLQLRPEQFARFKEYSKDDRQDLHDACEHIILTRHKDEDRTAAIKLRNYLMQLTLDKHNRCKFDETPMESGFERTAEYFPKKK